jgi:hypothetical protein
VKLTLSQKLERFPPLACRLLARRRLHSGSRRKLLPLTDAEIAARAGLTPWQVRAISCETRWNDIPVAQMVSFLRGCGIDLENRRSLWHHWRYLKSMRFEYLKSAPDYEDYFLPLAESYREAKP